MPGSFSESARSYFDAMSRIFDRVDDALIDQYADLLFGAWRDRRRVFVFGLKALEEVEDDAVIDEELFRLFGAWHDGFPEREWLAARVVRGRPACWAEVDSLKAVSPVEKGGEICLGLGKLAFAFRAAAL